ncbi:hypothetical protein B9Z19DRAFT_1120757 [Tuber borchii]|uniref:Uncharacterized protein n=1 Tax=Tuber borchii TaxID=42251 RepID=A0A2T7A3W3_TUBBO|nr:hypothetical protein B9Z19DRAFT_1120757 [Tuber borchii]
MITSNNHQQRSPATITNNDHQQRSPTTITSNDHQQRATGTTAKEKRQTPAAGLDTGGKMQDLVDRLKEFEDESCCDAILVTKSKIAATEDDTKENAKNAFKSTIDEEELEVRRERGQLYVGNLRGLGLAGLPEGLRILEEQDVARTGREMVKDAELATLKEEVSELKASQQLLKLTTIDYKRVRGRFVSVYKRDVLKIRTAWDKLIIDSGNVRAHEGDALIDALLYEYNTIGARPDFFVFVQLYGMNPQEVVKLTHRETIKVLNLHATVCANADQRPNPEFLAKFITFITEFQRSGNTEDYILVSPTVSTTRAAYDAVLVCPPYLKAE